jgi:hypothetical protein
MGTMLQEDAGDGKCVAFVLRRRYLDYQSRPRPSNQGSGILQPHLRTPQCLDGFPAPAALPLSQPWQQSVIFLNG